MTPERRKELEERAREWQGWGYGSVRGSSQILLDLLVTVDREAYERGREDEAEVKRG